MIVIPSIVGKVTFNRIKETGAVVEKTPDGYCPHRNERDGAIVKVKDMWLKDPKKVLKYIKEFKDEHDRKTSAKAEKESLNDRAFEMMRDDYPNAVVKFSEGYNIGTGKNYRYRPDIISVKTERGEIEFTYQENKHGDIAYSV